MKKTTLIFISCFIVSLSAVAQEGRKDITLEDIFNLRKFRSENVYGIQSMNKDEMFSQYKNDSLNLYSYKNGKRIGTVVTSKELIPLGDSTPISMREYRFSANEKKIIFTTETERIYRHSGKSNHYIYDIDRVVLTLLSANGKQQLASFSPDANKVAFVRDNNLFVVDLENDSELPITTDGEDNKIINGAPDWVYEEEFSFAKGFQWSPDGKRIAYYKFDESQVEEFEMTMWGGLYPDQYKYKYPKAGEDNSIVSIHIYNLETKETFTVDPGKETDYYIPRIKWTKDPYTLSVLWMNRLQNELKILFADAKTGESKTIYTESNKCYIDVADNLTFLNNGEKFIFTSEQDGYHHIYLFDLLGNLEQQITKGSWDVHQFLGVDEKKGILYYTSSESSPLNRDLYVIKLDGTGKKKLSDMVGTNSIKFSKQFKYYINSYSNANTPPLITVHDSKGKRIRTLKDNHTLKEITKAYHFSRKEFFTFTTPEGIDLNGWMIKPPDFDSTKKHPVLMYVYGGPGSQTVRNSWGGGNAWYQLLAQKGVIVVSIDNRGTGSRGEAFKKMTYMQLGKYETIDQIEAARYLGALFYVDEERIGIWGWSYGGYMTASCLTKGADYFTMGMAVAPVTNWRYYDNIYTERFMRTPQENPEGYDENSPVNHVDKLKGNLLIVHGTADDNVHFQNSIDLTAALVKANKQFDMQFYPNSNHGIYTGKNTRYHLYSLLTEYVIRTLIKKGD